MIRFRAMVIKEFIQMLRDPATIVIMVAMPIIQLLLFGFALRTDVKHMPTVVFDQARVTESRELLDTFVGTGYYDITHVAHSFDDVKHQIDSGAAKVGIIFPPDFGENLRHGRAGSVQVIVDASDSMTSGSAISTAQIVAQMKSQEVVQSRLMSAGGKTFVAPYDLRIRAWYNPDMVSEFYMVPAIMGMVLTMTLVAITSMAIVREREQGTLEQLMVTPLKPHELMLGKIIPYIVVGYTQIIIAILISRIIFDVPFEGSILLFFLLTTFFIIASLSLGVMISTFAENQMQAMQLSVFVIMLSVLLSGFMFPIAAMPTFFQYVSQVIPMTHYLVIVRGIMLKGIGIVDLWQPTLALAVFVVVTLTGAVLRFRKTM
ncbi:MAG: ABC transporter permease [Negativicoccus succinicivorans]|uniref:ABC transporter permease n=1 Tax=Negativicoccus succinicivorans TaxID=620903 RepID=UPI00291244F3|nr:ABC transporter permease [Negativicoccus succinicivorans]MDU5372046.1 ABC transporter permease [Negativicoccus succinicivorans]MDU5399340.1 ABC transporter permease [Negativicoccus succinicivorans]